MSVTGHNTENRENKINNIRCS